MMHFGGKRRRDLPINAEINLVNLVDVAFVLLIIFMITAPILQGGIEVQLPEADARPLQTSDDNTIVTIAADGTIYVGKVKVRSLAELESMLRSYRSRDKKEIVLKSDKSVNFGRAAEVMGVAQKLGLQLGVVVEPTNGR